MKIENFGEVQALIVEKFKVLVDYFKTPIKQQDGLDRLSQFTSEIATCITGNQMKSTFQQSATTENVEQKLVFPDVKVYLQPEIEIELRQTK